MPHYLVELKIEAAAGDDAAAKRIKSEIVGAAISAATRVSGVVTCTMHQLTGQNGQVVEKFNHPMERAIFP